MARITMALEWFTKILADYSNWLFAWAREAGQNSLDAGATAIRCNVELRDGNTVVEWSDNGKGMNRDILTNKFMAVGGSAKEAGNAGGFGIAKLVLAFAQLCYTIRTGFLFVTGRNDEYEIMETRDEHKGLTLTATMAGDNVVRFTEACEEWVRYTTPNRNVLFYLNGTALRFMGQAPPAASVQDWCTLHVCPEEMTAGVRVRINGQFMFSVWSEVSRCIIVELTGSSLEYLTSNRDSLQWHYKDKLTKLIAAMTRDPEVLFDTDSDVIELYKGELGAVNEERETVSVSLAPSPAGRPHWNATDEDCEEMSEETRRGNACQPIDSLRTTKRPDETRASRRVLEGNDFVILNKTNKPIPHKYTVDGMRPMEWRLLHKWTRIVEACAGILGFGRLTIRTGWIFSVSAQAAYKRSHEHGSLVLLNPCKLDGKAWVKGFDTSKDSFYTLVALAVHELTHIRHGYHDEGYAGALTDNMAKVFANMATVNKAK